VNFTEYPRVFMPANTRAVPAVERGRRGLRALADTLGAAGAKIVGGKLIARGPNFERERGRRARSIPGRHGYVRAARVRRQMTSRR
jgi:hypothetical protein